MLVGVANVVVDFFVVGVAVVNIENVEIELVQTWF